MTGRLLSERLRQIAPTHIERVVASELPYEGRQSINNNHSGEFYRRPKGFLIRCDAVADFSKASTTGTYDAELWARLRFFLQGRGPSNSVASGPVHQLRHSRGYRGGGEAAGADEACPW
jgi:hypothetical protein